MVEAPQQLEYKMNTGAKGEEIFKGKPRKLVKSQRRALMDYHLDYLLLGV